MKLKTQSAAAFWLACAAVYLGLFVLIALAIRWTGNPWCLAALLFSPTIQRGKDADAEKETES